MESESNQTYGVRIKPNLKKWSQERNQRMESTQVTKKSQDSANLKKWSQERNQRMEPTSRSGVKKEINVWSQPQELKPTI